MDAGYRIYLASASSRRGALLRQVGLPYRRLPVTVDEARRPGEAPDAYVRRLALAKARAGRLLCPPGDRRPVLGADTAVAVAGEVFGKPRDVEEARAMLRRLSGTTHHVYTGVAVVDDGREATRLSASAVTFRPLTDQECVRYWASGEPADKAGAYALQGRAAAFVSRLEGSYSGVVGLPLCETAALLREFSINLDEFWCPLA